MSGAQEVTAETNKQLLLSTIKAAIDNKTISGMEIYQFLSTDCGMGATDEQKEEVGVHHKIDDDCEIDDEAWVSEAYYGYWVHAWLWVPVEAADETADEPEEVD